MRWLSLLLSKKKMLIFNKVYPGTRLIKIDNNFHIFKITNTIRQNIRNIVTWLVNKIVGELLNSKGCNK